MVRQAARWIGVLTGILLLLLWLFLNGSLPGSVDLGAHLIAVVVSVLGGLFAYVTIMTE